MAQNISSAHPEHEDKLERLLQVAAEIFADRGYHHTSIRDLSRHAGVSLSGLYYYFSSKEELLFMIQERSLKRLLSALARTLEGVEDPAARLRLFVRNHVDFLVLNSSAMRVIQNEYYSLEGAYRSRITELRSRYTDVCTETLRDLRRLSGGGDAVPLNIATAALFGMMNGLYAGQRPDSNGPVERITDQLYGLFLGGFIGRSASPAQLAR